MTLRTILIVAFMNLALASHAAEASGVTLREWQRGIGVQPRDAADMSMYLWFYEWTLFDAIRPGPHNAGSHDFHREVGRDGQWAVIRSAMFELAVIAAEDGATLSLHVTNNSDHDWPEVAAIIPCFNPGPDPKNPRFTDADQKHTWFLGPDGLTPLVTRAIHFNERFRTQADARAQAGKFVFSDKWPTSPVNARDGLIVRESSDGQWVAAISWDEYMSVQGHNPWFCMHHSVRLGTLKKGESKVIRGRIYLFRGRKEDVVERHKKRQRALGAADQAYRATDAK